MQKVLLINITPWDILSEVPAILKKGGYTVHVFCSKDAWLLKNSFYDKWIEAPSDDSTLFVSQLIDHVTNEETGYDWILPGDDIIIRLLNKHIHDEQLFYKFLPITKIENREILGSKAGLSNLCLKYGLNTPKYIIYNEHFDIQNIEKHLNFPMMIKVDESEGGYGIFLCDDKKSFLNKFENITNKKNLVLQEYIKGYDVNTEALYKNGELLVYNHSRTLKTLFGIYGATTQRLCYQNTDVEKDLIKIGRDFGLNGFANILFRYCKSTYQNYLVEVDVRPNSWHFYGKFCGNDFSVGVRNTLNNNLVLTKQADKYKNKQVKITLFKKDITRCIVDNNYKGLFHWVINYEGRWRYIPFYDIKHLYNCSKFLLGMFIEATSKTLKKIFKK